MFTENVIAGLGSAEAVGVVRRNRLRRLRQLDLLHGVKK
jgi:hypothetical protein